MELSVIEKIKSLYKLQSIHTKVDDIHRLQGELPMEVRDLQDEIEGLDTRKEKLMNEINTFEDNIIARKKKIKESEENIKRYEKQMDEVKNNREFEALSKEIELQRLDIQIAEKGIREFSEQIILDTEKYEKVQEEIAVRTKDLESKNGELESIMKETEKEEKQLLAEAEIAEKDIEDRLLRAYHRLRNNFQNRMAVVTIDRNACTGCFNEIPPQRQVEIRQRKKINVCEHCGRIVIDQKTIDEVQETVEKV